MIIDTEDEAFVKFVVVVVLYEDWNLVRSFV